MIRLENVTIRSGGFTLEGVDLHVPEGCYAVLMGATGCGKSTLLEGLCGLKPIVKGRMMLAGNDVTNRRPCEHGVGYVPQDGALFTTMSVAENLSFSLRIRKWKASDIRSRVDELAGLLHIQHLLQRMPHGLSGGERQRVALGRALAYRPSILCLDEPLSALDADFRHEMYELLERIQSQLNITTLHVTHDRQEADRLANMLIQIVDGRINVIKVCDSAGKNESIQ